MATVEITIHLNSRICRVFSTIHYEKINELKNDPRDKKLEVPGEIAALICFEAE